MASRKEQTLYAPLADRDFNLRGFEFEGDLVVLDAMKRWAVKPDGTYEDFLRLAYWRESELSGGTVVDLSLDDSPLTLDQVMMLDPTVLSVRYDENDYSKHYRGTYGAGTQVVIGDECPTCHSFERNPKGKCVACALAAQHRQQEAHRLAHPEIEETRAAKQKAREATWAAQTLAAEQATAARRAAQAIRDAETAARRVARETAELERLAARRAEREEARIEAARERAAASLGRQAIETRFAGKPCRKCGSNIRYIKNKDCVACTAMFSRRAVERAREKRGLSVVK